MKKLSFFLMAMLFSVMSFAQEAIYTLDGTITGGSNGYADASSLTQDNIAWSVTGNTTMSPWRIGGKSITNQDRAVYSKNPLAYNIDKIELTHGTASSITVNSLKLIISDAANGAGETIDVTFKASATTTIDLPEGDYSNKYFKFLYNVTNSTNTNRYVQFTGAKFYAALAEDAVKAPIINGAEDFISETEVTIEAEDDVTVYYTLDGTEPTNASTVYAAPFTVKETTTVKAIAYRGETASFVTSATFTKATQLTCAEAAVEAMKVASNNATTNITYVVYGYVTELDGDLSSGQQKFWVSDTKGGENTFYSYFCNVPRALVVGDYIQMFGKLTKYNTTPQMKNGDVTLAEEPVIVEPTIECKDALDFGAVVYTDEVEGQTLEVTGYNLTSNITVTLSDDVFAVDQTTLPAEGGELVVTPVSPLAAGTHTATLTLTSGEATAEVTLTIVAKDVYTITWSVNGETSTTSVVEGDKLALPEAPEAPEACSEKVFVGWTAAEEVNADGSDITWVTAATVPAGDATYYAVFALQEGEGGAIETSVSVNIGEYASANSWTNQTQYLSMSIDENITATITEEGSYHNSGKYYDNGTNWRIYQNESPTLTIAAAEGITISTVAVTYSVSNTGVLTLGGANVESGAVCEINAASVTFGVGNTGSATNGQVRVTDIAIVYTSGAAATYTDYSTTCEAEIEWMEVELEMANLVTGVIEVEDAKYLSLTASDIMSEADVTLFLNNYADVDDDYEVNAENSLITFAGFEFTVLEGTISQTSETEKGTLYTGSVYAYTEIEGETMYAAFTLTMYAAPATVLVLTDAIVAINEKLGTLTFNVPTGEDEGYYAELAGYTAPGVHEGPQICLFETPEVAAYANYVETSVVDGVITLTGEFTSFMGAKFDLTISGTLPVEEPEVIEYVLNGGVLPLVGPTNAELWEAFKPYYNEYYGLARADQPIASVAVFLSAGMGDDATIFTSEDSDYKWLGDYIIKVTTEQNAALTNLANWKFNAQAFFNANQYTSWPKSADFTEAGKPENWVNVYPDAQEVVLPTEPVEEDYVLPTPTKSGNTFKGWYDNAEGTGEAYTVIPAGWAGTLYAIWEQGTTTALENIAVEGKAVKAIVNGQLIIIKNGVQYNAQGQVIK